MALWRFSLTPGLAVAVTKKVLGLPEYQNATRLSIYLSMPSGEVSTSSIVRDALNHGKMVFVPYIHKADASRHAVPPFMEMVALKSEADFEGFQPDAWGIPVPSEDSISERENALTGLEDEETSTAGKAVSGLDLILMPGVAFDGESRRLGHGKGFYDRYLQRHQSLLQGKSEIKMPYLGTKRLAIELMSSNSCAVGLALQEQVLSTGQQIPTGPDDWRVNRVISPDGFEQ